MVTELTDFAKCERMALVGARVIRSSQMVILNSTYWDLNAIFIIIKRTVKNSSALILNIGEGRARRRREGEQSAGHAIPYMVVG